MTKRLVDIDDDLLATARRVAGTRTIKATVEAGLLSLAATELTARHVRRLRQVGALDPVLVDEARTPRAPVDG